MGMAGWYALGPRPGDPGSSVILGQVDSGRGPAVFFRLRELRRGDEIKVTRAPPIVGAVRGRADRAIRQADRHRGASLTAVTVIDTASSRALNGSTSGCSAGPWLGCVPS
jgi:hypothetical protein